MSHFKAILLSDFTLNNFAGYLRNDTSWPRIEAKSGPFGQVMQVLINAESDLWLPKPEIGIVWTRPEATIGAFKRTLEFDTVALEEIFEDVDAYCSRLKQSQERVNWLFVPTWVLPTAHRGLGAMDLRPNGGLAHTLIHMNLRLIENMSSMPNCVVLDAQKWISNSGSGAFNPKLWYMGKIPFSNDVFKQAVRDIKAGIRGLMGQSKKLVILDLDETLWGGIVGDVGWHGLVLGGHNPIGEALVDFQKELKALKNRGIMLAVVSKNEESVALKAIRQHPEMVLKEDDLAAWRINWGDKARNIADLVSELNIGLDATVFIDDNPVERARVREALPDVFVPDWPDDKLLYRQALLALDCFDTGFVSNEDRKRAGMYASERRRSELKSSVGSLNQWLRTLETRVVVESLSRSNIERIAQLLNKTNQMNLTTRRMSNAELLDWASKGGRQVFAFRVSDRFGDSGLTGIASIEVHEHHADVVDFILSCRVMGRNVEQAMLAYLLEYARTQSSRKVFLRYRATTKNKPCLDFLLTSTLAQGPEANFFWDLSDRYPMPEHVEIQGPEIVVAQ